MCNFCCLLSLAKLLLSVLEKNIDLSSWRCRKWYWQEHSYSKLSGLNFMLDHHNLIECTLGLTTVSLSFFLSLSFCRRQAVLKMTDALSPGGTCILPHLMHQNAKIHIYVSHINDPLPWFLRKAFILLF